MHLGAAYRSLCRSSVLSDLDGFTAALARHGFEDIRLEDISWRVALSVMHVPFVSLAFVLASLRQGDRLGGWRPSNMVASLLTMAVEVSLLHRHGDATERPRNGWSRKR